MLSDRMYPSASGVLYTCIKYIRFAAINTNINIKLPTQTCLVLSVIYLENAFIRTEFSDFFTILAV